MESTPILGSHVMDGRPVLPMALILEWLAQGAMTRNPGMVYVGVDNLRLLKGVILREALPETIRALAGKGVRRDGHSVVPVELRGVLGDGREVLHARGEVVLGDHYPEVPAAAADPALPPYPMTRREIYRDVLFHGPGLQGIVAVEGCGDRGIAARVSTAPSPSEWVVSPLRNQWLTDPLALDAAFQMMILWSFEQAGSGSLPTFVGRYRQFPPVVPGRGRPRGRPGHRGHAPQGPAPTSISSTTAVGRLPGSKTTSASSTPRSRPRSAGTGRRRSRPSERAGDHGRG